MFKDAKDLDGTTKYARSCKERTGFMVGIWQPLLPQTTRNWASNGSGFWIRGRRK